MNGNISLPLSGTINARRLVNLSHAIVISAFFNVVAAMAWSSGAQAQQAEVRARHGDWRIECGKPAGSNAERCGAAQDVVSENHPGVGMLVVVLKYDKEYVLRVRTSLGVLLPRKLGLEVNQKDFGYVEFQRCFPEGCFAQAEINQALMSALKAGGTAVFKIYKTSEAGIGIPISLNGFEKAAASLK